MTASPPAVTVVGLGAMGHTLATAFVSAGHRTTVWNRSAGRAVDLVEAGAVEAASVGAAIESSPLTVICLLDRVAVEAVFDAAGERAGGRAIVNLTSSTPEDARALAERAAGAGIRYLAGTIMTPTTVVGTDDALVLYSGDGDVFADHGSTLRSLGGDAELLGEDHGLAAIYDLGMLDVFFTGMAAFLHAAALVGADGVPAATFVPYATKMLDLLRDTFAGLANDVDGGEHPGVDDNLDMELAFLDHIVHASVARGLDTSVPATPRALVAAAVDAGHGRDGFSRVIDVLRRPAA